MEYLIIAMIVDASENYGPGYGCLEHVVGARIEVLPERPAS